MERQVKERLVGASVLVAAAVILIPELLSGPKQSVTAPAPARAGEAPMKTYTIDLNHAPAARRSGSAIEERAPPQEPVVPPAAPLASPVAKEDIAIPLKRDAVAPALAATQAPLKEPAAAKSPQSQPEAKPESAAVKSSTAARPEKPAALQIADVDKKSKDADSQPAKPLVPAAKSPTSKQWVVQLGSFSSKTNAERLVTEWEGRGQQGSVSPVQAAGGTLYRARLGPFADRDAADEALRKVRASIGGAVIVALP